MTTMFLATAGGHLRQLDRLATRIDGAADALWVTNPDDQSRSLLEGRHVEYVPLVGPKDVVGVLRCLPHAHAAWRHHQITRAISTGSAIALGYLPYLVARGVDCHYVESATRVVGPSLTGRVLRRTPRVRLYAQYQNWARGPWAYAGNIFDGFRPTARPAIIGPELRVVVMLGIATGFPFGRLVRHLVPLLAADGPLSRAVRRPVTTVWQTGDTPVTAAPIRAVPTVPASELDGLLGTADIVISHAGTGSAIAALEQGKRPILAPREVGLGEIGDNHQTQLADELDRRGLALRRGADEIDVADLLAALTVGVERAVDPPPFELRS